MSQQDDTDALLSDLNQRAQSNPQRTSQDPDEAPEDLEAFLAGLEGDDDAPAPASTSAAARPTPAPAAPDPFLDDFAALEASLGDEVERELAAKEAARQAALAKNTPKKQDPPAKKPAKSPEDDLPEPSRAPQADTAEKSEKASDKDSKKKDKKKDQPPVKVVEAQRSPGFRFTIALLTWSLLLTPVMLSVWMLGAYLSRWLETGWITALITLGACLIPPTVARFTIKKGTWRLWAALISTLAIALMIAPWPNAAGEHLARFGHWPASTIAQLAKWDANSFPVRANASASGFLARQLLSIKDPSAVIEPIPAPQALGSDLTLDAWMKAQEAQKATESPAEPSSDTPAKDAAEKPAEKPVEPPPADAPKP